MNTTSQTTLTKKRTRLNMAHPPAATRRTRRRERVLAPGATTVAQRRGRFQESGKSPARGTARLSSSSAWGRRRGIKETHTRRPDG